MDALVRVALQPRPPVSGSHKDGGGAWHRGQMEAVRWLAVAASKAANPEYFLPHLRQVIEGGDIGTAELAVDAYFQVGDSAIRRTELQNMIPADKAHILDFNFQ